MAIGDIKKREYDTVGERQGICNFNAVGERDQRSDSCLLGEIKGASRELEERIREVIKEEQGKLRVQSSSSSALPTLSSFLDFDLFCRTDRRQILG